MELTFQQEAESHPNRHSRHRSNRLPNSRDPPPKSFLATTWCACACLLELYLGILFRTHLVFKFRQVLSIVNEINQLKHT